MPSRSCFMKAFDWEAAAKEGAMGKSSDTICKHFSLSLQMFRAGYQSVYCFKKHAIVCKLSQCFSWFRGQQNCFVLCNIYLAHTLKENDRNTGTSTVCSVLKGLYRETHTYFEAFYNKHALWICLLCAFSTTFHGHWIDFRNIVY